MSLKVNPYHGLIIGALLLLISFSGSTQVLDDRVVVPENGYLEWSMHVYPGQTLRVGASAIADDRSEVTRDVLEIVIMDDESFASYESGDYIKVRELDQELIHTNSWDWIDIDLWQFGRIHVVLNNRIRVVDSDRSKEADFNITIFRPFSYIFIPGVVLMGICLLKSYKQSKKGP